jgi:aquaporin Z
MTMRAAFLEFLGAFAITFFGAYSRLNNADNLLAVGLTYFLLVSSLSYAFIKLSGGQFNPVLSLSLLITKQISPMKAGVYICFQLLGSLVAGMFLFALYHSPHQLINRYYGEPMLNESHKLIAVSLDMISMVMLVFVYSILADQSNYRHVFGVAHGTVYITNILAFGHISGGCINLVELIGPSLFARNLRYWPYYIFAQILGAVVSAVICKVFLKKQRAFPIYSSSVSQEVEQKKNE